MAIDAFMLELLRHVPARGELLCLGYPDLLATAEQLDGVGVSSLPEVTSEAVQRWHGWTLPIYDTDAALRQLGWSPVYIDIAPARGIERRVDLNVPLPDDLRCRFMAVFDGGTVEHCANIGQAFRNVALALAPGGHVVHVNPAVAMNHGFYNICPTLYHELYRTVLEHFVIWGPVLRRSIAKVQAPHARASYPDESHHVVVARDPVDAWPMQRKYRVASPT